MPYPSFLYHHPPDASSFRLGNPGPTSTAMPENRHLACSPSKDSRKANFHPNGHLIHPLVPHGGPSQLDFWGLTAESPRASTLTNDDFLDMVSRLYLKSTKLWSLDIIDMTRVLIATMIFMIPLIYCQLSEVWQYT
ncbi:hypothetical protein LINPERPRIM_LOCUS35839 [Linum perenne]